MHNRVLPLSFWLWFCLCLNLLTETRMTHNRLAATVTPQRPYTSAVTPVTQTKNAHGMDF